MQIGGGNGEAYQAADFTNEVQVNDIVLMASDGVFENMYDKDLADCVKQYMDSFTLVSPKDASDCITKKSDELSKKDYYLSPVVKRANVDYGMNLQFKGKTDDMTVIIA